MTVILLAALLGFTLSAILAPFVIKWMVRARAGQTILSYVDNHQKKQGTPTMGGVFFIVGASVAAFALMRGSMQLGLVAVASFLGYGLLGFLDDFLKVHYKRNMGLAAYQKIIGQLGLALIVGFFAYYNEWIGTSILIPFTDIAVDLRWGIVPLSALVMVAVSNTVNLTDGLDGLAGSTVLSYLVPFSALVLILYEGYIGDGIGAVEAQEWRNLLVVMGAVGGAVLAFLLFNAHPAKIFMGDTGSLALGGILAVLSVFTKTELYVPIFGIMFVVSGISVILQVFYFKLTKKRIFLMAPFHHHLERKGMHEVQIVMLYVAVTLLVGAASVLALLSL